MKKWFSVLMLLSGVLVFSQSTDSFSELKKQSEMSDFVKFMRTSGPIIIVDDDIFIRGLQTLDLSKVKIKFTKLYKTREELPGHLQSFSNIISKGLIYIMLNDKLNFEKYSLKELNIENKLNERNPVFIDGREVIDTRLFIIKDGIAEISIIDVKGKNYVAIYSTSKIDTEIR